MTSESGDAGGALQASGAHPRLWLQRTATLILWSLLGLAIYSAAVPVWFRIRGWQVVTLVSGSMSPLYPTGSDLILTSVADPAAVPVGDVITVTEGRGLPVTHRVVERVVLPAGVAYRMKGDANAAPDSILVPADRVLGRIQRAVPGWADLAIWIEKTNARFIVFGLPLAWLLTMEFTNVLIEWKRRARARGNISPLGGGSGVGTGIGG